ncbi:MAG: ParA family protein [Gammaproteobacteria bacterium]|nr:ParA family protein [Gammaproteobacteria bacterium]MDH5691882.1 ParA family protein [Gammaproteobacteria bacterium]
MRRISVVNQKGGVGKTTSALNIAHAFALSGKRVMLIDADPQGHLSASFGLKELGLKGTDEVLMKEGSLEALKLEIRDNLFLLAAGDKLGELEFLSQGGASRGYRLQRAIDAVEGEYDYVIIDCPPSAGMIGMNCILAAEELLIPVSSDFLSLHGLSRLMGIIDYIENALSIETKKWITITRFQERRLLAREVRKKLIENYPDTVLKTPIRETVVIAESPGHGQSIFDYRPRSKGAEDYRSLAHDIECRNVFGSLREVEVA